MPHKTQNTSPHVAFASDLSGPPPAPLMKTRSLPDEAMYPPSPNPISSSSRGSSMPPHYPIPPHMMNMPSPASTVSSIPSSAGPFTPPNFLGGLYPAPRASSSTSSRSHAPHPSAAGDIHSLLHPTPGVPSRITWHVMRDPNLAVVASSASSRSSSSRPSPSQAMPWHDVITAGPVPEVVVYIQGFPWTIAVRASNPARGITFAEFIGRIFESLRKKPTVDEWRRTTKEVAERAQFAMQRRAKRIEDEATAKTEINVGVRRGDFLEAKVFAGIVVHPGGMWQLILC